ncbi:MAG: transposase [Candidatus Krumholzibacteria bacterium]|nr:transposase [Candidatus Krumholzibacteria bacterium]
MEDIEMENLAIRETGAEVGTEVVGVARRRSFSDAYKRRILEEADRAQPGEIGLILRREGLYSSQLATWRKWRSGVTSKKKTGKGVVDIAAYKRLEKENAKLKLKLRKAEAMLELQKKAHEIMGYDDETEESSS